MDLLRIHHNTQATGRQSGIDPLRNMGSSCGNGADRLDPALVFGNARLIATPALTTAPRGFTVKPIPDHGRDRMTLAEHLPVSVYYSIFSVLPDSPSMRIPV